MIKKDTSDKRKNGQNLEPSYGRSVQLRVATLSLPHIDPAFHSVFCLLCLSARTYARHTIYLSDAHKGLLPIIINKTRPLRLLITSMDAGSLLQVIIAMTFF